MPCFTVWGAGRQCSLLNVILTTPVRKVLSMSLFHKWRNASSEKWREKPLENCPKSTWRSGVSTHLLVPYKRPPPSQGERTPHLPASIHLLPPLSQILFSYFNLDLLIFLISWRCWNISLLSSSPCGALVLQRAAMSHWSLVWGLLFPLEIPFTYDKKLTQCYCIFLTVHLQAAIWK